MIVSGLNENESQEREQGGIMWREIEFHLYRGHLLTLPRLRRKWSRAFFSLCSFALSLSLETVFQSILSLSLSLSLLSLFQPRLVHIPLSFCDIWANTPFNIPITLIRPFQNDTTALWCLITVSTSFLRWKCLRTVPSFNVSERTQKGLGWSIGTGLGRAKQQEKTRLTHRTLVYCVVVVFVQGFWQNQRFGGVYFLFFVPFFFFTQGKMCADAWCIGDTFIVVVYSTC